MSMTDGHLLFRSALYNQGQRPAIDITLSVSRVGQQTQERVQNLLSNHSKQVLAKAAQLETVSRFSFELPAETRLILNQSEIINELIKQPSLTYIPKEIQTILLALPFTPAFQDKDREKVQTFQKSLISVLLQNPAVIKLAKEIFKLPGEKELLRSLDGIARELGQFIDPPPKYTLGKESPCKP